MATSKPDKPADTVQPDQPAAVQAPAQALASLATPAAGGRYTRDPVSGELTLAEPSTEPAAGRRVSATPTTSATPATKE